MKTTKLLYPLIVSVLLGSAFAFAVETDCKDDTRYPEISFQDLTTAIESKKAFVIDVNSKSSFAKQKVDGAVHFGANEGKLSELLPKDKGALIVAYCGNEMCTAWKSAAAAACKLGYTNIRHFKPGIKGWMKLKQESKAKS